MQKKKCSSSCSDYGTTGKKCAVNGDVCFLFKKIIKLSFEQLKLSRTCLNVTRIIWNIYWGLLKANNVDHKHVNIHIGTLNFYQDTVRSYVAQSVTISLSEGVLNN